MTAADRPIPFVKGHGTENDFVLLPDPTGALEISAAAVRAICDRRAGLGGDGVIRIAPGEGGRWFMDYRNADGSAAEMCGNGARLFARYLVDEGWAEPGRFEFDTRGGVRTAELGRAGDVRIDMGPVVVGGTSTGTVAGRPVAGRVVSVGNPHLVCAVSDLTTLAALDLTSGVAVDPADFPDGANVEFVVPGPPAGPPAGPSEDSAGRSAGRADGDSVTMRVYERGVGETRSCGTGTVAVAAAHLFDTGAGTVRVRVPGGTVVVDIRADTAMLTGPAVIVARGELSAEFLAAAG